MNREKCPDCFGHGKTLKIEGINSMCIRCLGTGHIVTLNYPCPVCYETRINPYFKYICTLCNGNGYLLDKKLIELIEKCKKIKISKMKKLLLINRDK